MAVVLVWLKTFQIKAFNFMEAFSDFQVCLFPFTYIFKESYSSLFNAKALIAIINYTAMRKLSPSIRWCLQRVAVAEVRLNVPD